MSDYASRRDRRMAAKWPAVRARGMWRFVLLWGVAFWGGLMLAFMIALMLFQFGIHHPRLPLMLAIAAPLCAIGGLFWGLSYWFLTERAFESLQQRKKGIT